MGLLKLDDLDPAVALSCGREAVLCVDQVLLPCELEKLLGLHIH